MTPFEDGPPELLVVMPVYNEEAAIGRVVHEWLEVLARHVTAFALLVINDGSRDDTLARLETLQQRFGQRLQVISRENRGHGQTCLEGYRVAIDRHVPYVMQIDSDGQCDPRFFEAFWRRRETCDVVYGRRVRRDDGWQRTAASRVVKLVVWMRTGVFCVDPNVPYRLMRTSMLPSVIDRIPPDFFLANVALAVLLRREPRVRHDSIPIHFRDRIGGMPSVRLSQFATRARQLVRQLGQLRPVH